MGRIGRTPLVALSGATLFYLELHVGHALAPALGGGALVWLTTLLIFQVLLLIGYASASLLLPADTQRRVTAGLLVAGAILGPFGFVHGVGVGTLFIALGLATVLPFTLRAGADAPEAERGRWIAASNAGALVGLAVYAAAEPWLGLAAGATVPRIPALLLGLLVLRLPVADAARTPYRPNRATIASAFVGVFWYMSHHARLESTLPPSVQLWAITLALYLVSFALPFLRERGATRWRVLAVGVAAIASLVAETTGTTGRTVAGLVALFVGAIAAHAAMRGDFDARRPWTHGAVDAAIGGALGGTLALAVVPLVHTTHEQILLAVLALVGLEIARARPKREVRVATAALGAAAIGLAFVQPFQGPDTIRTVRSWYGEFRVKQYEADNALHHHLALEHQHTVHGAQYLADDLLDLPTAYYSIYSGAGMALDALQDARGSDAILRLGVVGLGTGALASYADANDTVRFFEIDARNAALNRPPDPVFRFLDVCEGTTDVVVADGRRALQREEDRGTPRYDALLLDAFSGGHVPTHLLTLEAFELYASRVRRDGWIAVHTSNTALDLRPVIYRAAEHVGARAWFVRNRARGANDPTVEHTHLVMLADWIVIGWDGSPWAALEARLRPASDRRDVTVQEGSLVEFVGIEAWTDDRRSVWPLWQSRVAERERRARP